MKKKFSYLMVLFALIGCDSKENIPEQGEPQKVNFTITKSVSDFSTSNFAIGDEVGIYIATKNAVLSPSGNHFNNEKLVMKEGGFASSTAIEYPKEVSEFDVYAYSPYVATGIDANKKVSFTIETTQSNLSKSDLLWVKKAGFTPSSTPENLVFDHKLSKVIINIIAGEGVVLASPEVSVHKILPTVKMDLSSGVLDAAEGSATVIQSKTISDTEKQLIIVPQTVAKEGDFISVVNGGTTFNWSLPSDKTFEAGKVYTFNITVKKNGIEVVISGAINEWNPGDTTNGEAAI